MALHIMRWKSCGSAQSSREEGSQELKLLGWSDGFFNYLCIELDGGRRRGNDRRESGRQSRRGAVDASSSDPEYGHK